MIEDKLRVVTMTDESKFYNPLKKESTVTLHNMNGIKPKRVCNSCGVLKTERSFHKDSMKCIKCEKKEYPLWAYNPGNWKNNKIFIGRLIIIHKTSYAEQWKAA